MTDPAALLAALPAWSFAFVLLLSRIGGAMALLPGIGDSSVPAMIRAGLALTITLVLLPVIAPAMPPTPEAGLQAAGMIAAELLTGLWLGWLARMFTLALPLAAQFIAYLLGTATVLQPSSELGGRTTALSHLFELAVPVAVLTSGLYALPLTALAGSYRVIPAGTLLPAGDGAVLSVKMVGAMFALALRLAAPFVLASIVWHVAIGLLARLVPRIQVYFVAMPGQILGGLLLLAVLSGAILSAYLEAMRDGLSGLPGLS